MNDTTKKPPLRVGAVLLATLAAIGVPAVQMGMGLGLSQREFAAMGDTTLRAATYAFSIWSVIYLGLIAYAVWQALPRTRESALLRAFGWPSVGAIAGCGLWIVAASADLKWATVAVILAAAACAVAPLLHHADEVRAARGRERALVLWPLGMLAGWLTIASALNLLTVLTAEGMIGPETAPAWGAAGVLAVVAVGLAVTWRTRLFAYAIPIAWGLVAVFVAERTPKPTLANLPLIGSLLILALGGAAALSRQRRKQ
jgi:hypothetical protein